MKTRLIRLFFASLFLLAGHFLFAQQQNAYTYYNNLAFAIKKVYSLERNTNFLNTARQIKNGPKILDAFVCAQNIEKNDPDQINIINIHAWEGAMPYIIAGAIMSLIILAVQTCS